MGLMRLPSVSEFGPSAARRLAASSDDSPAELEPRCFITASEGWLCQTMPLGFSGVSVALLMG